jgi:hypothetical protein
MKNDERNIRRREKKKSKTIDNLAMKLFGMMSSASPSAVVPKIDCTQDTSSLLVDAQLGQIEAGKVDNDYKGSLNNRNLKAKLSRKKVRAAAKHLW